MIPLTSLKIGQAATIISFENEQVKLTLNEMGFIENGIVILERIAPMGDPIIISNNDYSLSIRKSEAQLVNVALLP